MLWFKKIPRPSWLKPLQWLIRIVVSLVIFLALLVMLLWFGLSSPAFLNTLSGRLYSLTKVAFELQDIKVSLADPVHIQAKGLVIYTDQQKLEKVLSVKELDLSLHYLGLLRGEINIGNIFVKGLDFKLVQDKTGKFLWELMNQPSKPKPPSAAPFVSADSIKVVDSKFLYANEKVRLGVKIDIVELSTQHWQLSGSHPFRWNTYAKYYQGSIEDPSFYASGQLDGTIGLDFATYLNQIQIFGDVAFNNFRLFPVLQTLPAAHLKLNFVNDFERSQYRFDQAELKFGKSNLQARGLVDVKMGRIPMLIDLKTSDWQDILSLLGIKSAQKLRIPSHVYSAFTYDWTDASNGVYAPWASLETEHSKVWFRGFLNHLNQSQEYWGINLEANAHAKSLKSELDALSIRVMKKDSSAGLALEAHGALKAFDFHFRGTWLGNVKLFLATNNHFNNQGFASHFTFSVQSPSLRGALFPFTQVVYDSPFSARVEGNFRSKPLNFSLQSLTFKAFDHELSGKVRYQASNLAQPVLGALALTDLGSHASEFFQIPAHEPLRTKGWFDLSRGTSASGAKTWQIIGKVQNGLYQSRTSASIENVFSSNRSFTFQGQATLDFTNLKLFPTALRPYLVAEPAMLDFGGAGTGHSLSLSKLLMRYHGVEIQFQPSELDWAAHRLDLGLAFRHIHLEDFLPPASLLQTAASETKVETLSAKTADEAAPISVNQVNLRQPLEKNKNWGGKNNIGSFSSEQAKHKTSALPPPFKDQKDLYHLALLPLAVQQAMLDWQVSIHIALTDIHYRNLHGDSTLVIDSKPAASTRIDLNSQIVWDNTQNELALHLRYHPKFWWLLEGNLVQNTGSLMPLNKTLAADFQIQAKGENLAQVLQSLEFHFKTEAKGFTLPTSLSGKATPWLVSGQIELKGDPQSFHLGVDKVVAEKAAGAYLLLPQGQIDGSAFWKNLPTQDFPDVTLQKISLEGARLYLQRESKPVTEFHVDAALRQVFSIFQQLEINPVLENRQFTPIFLWASLPNINLNQFKLRDCETILANSETGDLQRIRLDLSSTKPFVLKGSGELETQIMYSAYPSGVQDWLKLPVGSAFPLSPSTRVMDIKDHTAWWDKYLAAWDSSPGQFVQIHTRLKTQARPEQEFITFQGNIETTFPSAKELPNLAAEVAGQMNTAEPKLEAQIQVQAGEDKKLAVQIKLNHFFDQPAFVADIQGDIADLSPWFGPLRAKQTQQSFHQEYPLKLNTHIAWQNGLFNIQTPEFQVGPHRLSLTAETKPIGTETIFAPAQYKSMGNLQASSAYFTPREDYPNRFSLTKSSSTLMLNQLEFTIDDFPTLLVELFDLDMGKNARPADPRLVFRLYHGQDQGWGRFFAGLTSPFDEASLLIEAQPKTHKLRVDANIGKLNLDAYGLASKPPKTAAVAMQPAPAPKSGNVFEQPFFHAPLFRRKEYLDSQILLRGHLAGVERNKILLDPINFEVGFSQGLGWLKSLSIGSSGAHQIDTHGSLDLRPALPIWDFSHRFSQLNFKSLSQFATGQPLVDAKLDGTIELRSQGNSLAEILANLQGEIDLSSGRIILNGLPELDNYSCKAVGALRSSIFTEKVADNSRLDRLKIALPIIDGRLWIDNSTQIDLPAFKIRNGSGYIDLNDLGSDFQLKIDLTGDPRYKTCSMPLFSPTYRIQVNCKGSLLSLASEYGVCDISSTDKALVASSVLTSILNPLEWVRKIWDWIFD